jgi:uncharacterized membrane protein
MVQWSKPGSLALSIIALQSSLLFAVFFDIPVARQVIGFLCLTFVPGYLIVRFLRLKLGLLETVLFSLGLSIAFWMLSTFFTNLILPSLGIVAPLTPLSTLLIETLMIIVLVITEWRSPANLELSVPTNRLVLWGFLLLLPICLALVGVFLVRSPPHTNNAVLLIMTITISVLVSLPFLRGKLFPQKLLPLLLLVTSVSLLLHIALFSSNLIGGDIFGEYTTFKTTLNNSYWDPSVSSLLLMGRLSSMLSITTLPASYSLILNLDPLWVFKIVYPLIFAFIPLALYQMCKSRFGIEVSFLSVFFFVSNLTFFTEIAQLARQMIGELFYVLLFLTVFSRNASGSKKWFLLSVFGFGLVASHYALAYIFLALVAITWLISRATKSSPKITVSFIVLLGIIIFAWYIYTTQASTFNDLLDSINYVGRGFASDFLNPNSRSGAVLQAVGASGISTPWHLIGRGVFYATEGLIILSLVFTLIKDRLSFFKDDYNVLSFLNLLLLGACIVVPNFSGTFNATRFYQLSLFFLAPLCVLGGLNVLRFFSRKKISKRLALSLLLFCLLIPYFLFQTGLVYEVTNEDSYSLPLSSYRINSSTQAGLGLLKDAEVQSGRWLSIYADVEKVIYVDPSSYTILIYTEVKSPSAIFSSAATVSGSYVFLREHNVATGIVYSDQIGFFNITEISPSISDTDLIYSSSSCQVFSVP